MVISKNEDASSGFDDVEKVRDAVDF